MELSPDSKYLFTGGEDGVLFVYAISEMIDNKTTIKGSFAARAVESSVPDKEEEHI